MKDLPKGWRPVLLPVIAVTVLALYPQISIFLAQGSNWHGSYFQSHYDEAAYSAYINALANGRPRRFDPFVGRVEDSESLYSIQFIPAYLIAGPERLFGVSTSTSFIILIAAIGIFSVLTLFFLILELTSSDLLAAAGSIVILCLGTAVAFQGELRYLIEGRMLIEYLPFLRRYQPGLAFPLFFVFCWLVWRSLNSETIGNIAAYSAAAGAVFLLLVFSYFYIWTAAAAWLGCLSLFWAIWKRDRMRQLVIADAIVGIFALSALIPYFMLLGRRSTNVDSVQLLTLTHSPAFTSPSMAIGVIVAIALILTARKGVDGLREPKTIMALSFALTPVILFNQQIVTGRSLQPAHYEIFIANYLVLLAAVLAVSIWKGSEFVESTSQIYRKAILYVALIAFGWGFVEAMGSAGRSAASAVVRDESMPALQYIQQQSTLNNPASTFVVHATNFVTADLIPSVTTQRPLWNSHINSAGGVDAAEHKRLFYSYLYYNGFTANDLLDVLSKRSFEVTAALFGSDRALPELAQGAKRVTDEEIRNEVRGYADFIRTFTREQAADPELSWLIVPVKSDQDLSNIDRWYRRSDEQEFGMFKVYKLTLK